jgi:hypothetical protein
MLNFRRNFEVLVDRLGILLQSSMCHDYIRNPVLRSHCFVCSTSRDLRIIAKTFLLFATHRQMDRYRFQLHLVDNRHVVRSDMVADIHPISILLPQDCHLSTPVKHNNRRSRNDALECMCYKLDHLFCTGWASCLPLFNARCNGRTLIWTIWS